MLKEKLYYLDLKYPSLSNLSKIRMLKVSNKESNKLYSLVDDKIIEMPIYSEAKNNIVNYLYSVLNEDGKNQVEKYADLFQGEYNHITFDLAVNFDEKKEYKIFSHPDAYFIRGIESVYFIVERENLILKVNSENNSIEFEIEKIYTPENLVKIFDKGQIYGMGMAHDFQRFNQIKAGKAKFIDGVLYPDNYQKKH